MQNTKRERRFPKKPASVRPLKSDGDSNEDDSTSGATSRLERRVIQKQQNYFDLANRYKTLYYGVRLCVGFAAGLLPFFVTWNPTVAIVLSVAVVIGTVLDSVLTPHAKWKTFSRASDLLFLIEAKESGDYEKFSGAIEVILETESKAVSELLEVQSLVEAANDGQTAQQEVAKP